MPVARRLLCQTQNSCFCRTNIYVVSNGTVGLGGEGEWNGCHGVADLTVRELLSVSSSPCHQCKSFVTMGEERSFNSQDAD